MARFTSEKTMLYSAIDMSNPNIISKFNFTLDMAIYNCNTCYLLDSEILKIKKKNLIILRHKVKQNIGFIINYATYH